MNRRAPDFNERVDTMTTTETTSTLTVEQQQRAEALDRARKALTAKGFASDGAADAMDLIHVAGWIIDSRDPWAEHSEPDTFRMAVHAATDAAVDQLTDVTGIDPDAPLLADGDAQSDDPDWHDEDDDQVRSVTA